MKNHTVFAKIISFAAIITLMCGIALAEVADFADFADFAENPELLKGIWAGDLEVGPEKVLNTAVVLSVDEDNELSALFKIIGQGDVPVDTVTVKDNTIALVVKVAPFTIKGTIDLENETIKSEFIQGENLIPLILKRVETLPETSN
ncbi:hypothetical protein ACFL6P_07460 [Candidatus Latescibacterota bacterium]